MNTEQKQVILDAATEMQVNEKWWEEFEFRYQDQEYSMCSKDTNPLEIFSCSLYTFRRRPKTITVTMPVPERAKKSVEHADALYIVYKDDETATAALTAIRAKMERNK